MRKFSLNVVNISKKYSRKKPLVPEKMRGGASMIVLELNFFYRSRKHWGEGGVNAI